ncbi:MAG TPA: hypothetical protein VFB60_07095 [Ktedonobacteraceae bacterium]|nr:hypothetical protein [Ktedonobacteraceae bacterium]
MLQERFTTEAIYRPAVALVQATFKHSLASIPLVNIDTPEAICGRARRIGYCGSQKENFALYRLKIHRQSRNGKVTATLPGLFVLDGGVFHLFATPGDEASD